jgi:hypothetical protein
MLLAASLLLVAAGVLAFSLGRRGVQRLGNYETPAGAVMFGGAAATLVGLLLFLLALPLGALVLGAALYVAWRRGWL